jgi:hypothetical protein
MGAAPSLQLSASRGVDAAAEHDADAERQGDEYERFAGGHGH